MALTPAEAFDKYVRENSEFVTRDGLRIPVFRGRQHLTELHREDLRSLLANLQNGFNEALAQRKKVPEHLDDLPFYLDYIDSDFSNAVAFRDDSSAFIGITVPLVYELLKICALLSDSEPIRRILGLENTQELRDWLNIVLFQHLLSLVVTHEFTHHVHGHVLKHQSQSKFFSEFVAGNQNTNIERQAEEADADGYAAYHVLANFIDGGTRKNISAVLKLDSALPDVVDQVLFSCFVIVAGAFLFSRPPVDLTKEDLSGLSHPPQAARLDYLMRHSILWCKENRPSLVDWMTNDRFQQTMRAVAEATWGMNGGLNWDAQTTFLRSERGEKYLQELSRLIDAQKAALRASADASFQEAQGDVESLQSQRFFRTFFQAASSSRIGHGLREYIEQRNGGYFIKGTRISLDSVVYAFLRGESPEGIAESFPDLSLEEIFGALAFYMANRKIIDHYLAEGRLEFEALRQQARRDNPVLYSKLADARHRTHMPKA